MVSQRQKIPINKIIIQWIPSHTNIPGNDNADILAKNSLEMSYITQTQYSIRDTHRIINRYYQSKNLNHWHSLNLETSSPIALKTTNMPFPHLSSPRTIQVALTRLHLQVSKLTRQHFFTKELPSSCHHCELRQTFYHILVMCPEFELARSSLKAECSRIKKAFSMNTLLDGSFSVEILVKFLSETNMLKKLWKAGYSLNNQTASMWD